MKKLLIVTVSQLNRYVKSILEEDAKLQDVYIKGEISNFKAHFSSGHMYFSLKGDKSSVRAVMFRGYASKLKFTPEEGMEVIARASVGLYEVDGSYQVYVTDMQPDGLGALELALKQLKEKLEKKGYFLEEHKKDLPEYPSTIGVITSKTGAAFGDIEQVLSRRYPLAKIKFVPSFVQGEKAAASLIQGIKALDNNCDVIIIGRGGGSKEDLWAFNDEKLADAIFYATTPIISAVGHEMDISICDLVADRRAPTPSAAAELAAPSLEDIRLNLAKNQSTIINYAKNSLETYAQRLDNITSTPILRSPHFYIREKKKKLDFLYNTMYNMHKEYALNLQTNLQNKAQILDSLSPFAVLARGYSAVFKDEKPIRSIKQLKKNDEVNLKFSDGDLKATVKEIMEG